MISESFILKVAEISHDREKLVELMNTLDEEKRSIKDFMRKYSNSPKTEGGGAGAERFKKLRRIKARQSFLIEEREYVRQMLGEMKGNQKALNRVANSRSVEFQTAFMAAAERLLDEETFVNIEIKATEILKSHKNNQ